MIAYVKGKVLSASNGTVILERDGLGFEIICSATSFKRLVESGEGAVYTYLAVRDDGMSLFGFENLAEKDMFLKLISVSGVGPKMGMTVLSGLSLNDLAFAIASSDVKALSSVKGLGKKTAERIILELREAISIESLGAPSGKAKPNAVKADSEKDNAVLALISLGYKRDEAVEAVEIALSSGAVGLEKVITAALKCFLK